MRKLAFLDTLGRIRDADGTGLSWHVGRDRKESTMKPSRLTARGNPLGRQQEAQVRPDAQAQEEYEEAVTIAVPPLTGRDTEFGLLRDRWEQAQEGMGQVVLVVGQPGLGKSRLVQTLTQRVQADPSEEPVAAAGRIGK